MKHRGTIVQWAGVAVLLLGMDTGFPAPAAAGAGDDGTVVFTAYLEADLPEFPSDPPTVWQDIPDIRGELLYARGTDGQDDMAAIGGDLVNYDAGDSEYREPGGLAIGEARSAGDRLHFQGIGWASIDLDYDWHRVGLLLLVDLSNVDATNVQGASIVGDGNGNGSGTAVGAFVPGAKALSALGSGSPVNTLGNGLFDFLDAGTDRSEPGFGTINSLFDDGDNAITSSIAVSALVSD